MFYNAAFRCVVIHYAGDQPPQQKKYRNCQQDRQNGELILKEPEHTAQHFPCKNYRKMSNQRMADETREVRQMMSDIIYSILDGWGEEYEQIRQDD